MCYFGYMCFLGEQTCTCPAGDEQLTASKRPQEGELLPCAHMPPTTTLCPSPSTPHNCRKPFPYSLTPPPHTHTNLNAATVSTHLQEGGLSTPVLPNEPIAAPNVQLNAAVLDHLIAPPPPRPQNPVSAHTSGHSHSSHCCPLLPFLCSAVARPMPHPPLTPTPTPIPQPKVPAHIPTCRKEVFPHPFCPMSP
jgi:hypothetical protein